MSDKDPLDKLNTPTNTFRKFFEKTHPCVFREEEPKEEEDDSD